MTVERKQLILAWYGLIEPEEVDGIWGPRSAAATRKLQKALELTPDGVFGTATAGAVWNAIYEGRELQFDVTDNNVGDNPSPTGTFWDDVAEYFVREEFRCKCGGKYCSGFPAEPREELVRIAYRLRKNLGVPVAIVSGLRCQRWNAIQGGVANSQHIYGEALDVRAKGKSQAEVEAELDRIGGVRYHYPIKGSTNVHFDIPKGKR